MSIFEQLYQIIIETDPLPKCEGVQRIYKSCQTDTTIDFSTHDLIHEIKVPGLPKQLKLVYPRELKRRGIQKQEGRNVLMHSIAHIEFNAINLALDAAYRFRDQPHNYYRDWLRVANDEARHFQMINSYLIKHDSYYGQFPAHNGLWQMSVETQHDVMARMALVPRVLEARGLDVTPGIIKRLNTVNDNDAAAILEVIYQDEIEHVNIGSRWFKYYCQQAELEPKQTFMQLVDKHLHGELKGPFNLPARLLAGFEQEELDQLERSIV